MKKLLLLLLLFFSACSANQVVEVDKVDLKDAEVKTVIVAYGDSLTEGLGVDKEDAYPSQLESRLLEEGYEGVKVYNSGVSGETSSGALNRVNWVLRLKPDVVLLGIGANDAMRGIDLNLTESNIREIVRVLKENNVEVILLGQIIFENLGKDYVSQFEEIYPKVTKDENLTFVPNFLEGVAANESLNNNDQIHPNKEGYKIIVENNLLPKVIEVLGKNKKLLNRE